MELSFQAKSFCFTGALADLKRSAAQREVRARGGLTQDRVNERLDYLVIGSKGSHGWKHGSFGRKIEGARELNRSHGFPALVSEPQFMEALAAVPPSNSGAIDAKVIVVTYKFTTPDPPSFDQDGLERSLTSLQQNNAHITVKSFPILAYRELFDHATLGDGAYLVIEIRLVRQSQLSFDSGAWLSEIERSFEQVAGVDGTARWFERSEGSADYVRLLGEVPQVLRIAES